MAETTLEIAIRTAREAGDLLLERFSLWGTRGTLKPDRSIVTQADLDADQLIASAIQEAFPGDGLISEELSPHSPTKPGPVWVVDPLDGTTNFSLGIPFWGVSIARLAGGRPDLGVLYFPTIQELYWAQRGRGAFLNGEVLRLKPPEKGQTSAFFACCSRSHRRYQIDVRFKPRILGSAAYNLCAVARGSAIAGFEAVPKVWDLAAGWLVIEEAGGIVEPLDGGSPFPIAQDCDYRLLGYPTVSAATREVADIVRANIRPRQAAARD